LLRESRGRPGTSATAGTSFGPDPIDDVFGPGPGPPGSPRGDCLPELRGHEAQDPRPGDRARAPASVVLSQDDFRFHFERSRSGSVGGILGETTEERRTIEGGE